MVRQTFFLFCSLLMMLPIYGNSVADFPKVSEKAQTNWFSLGEATICTDASDYKVVNIAAQMLADDVERVTTTRSTIVSATSVGQTEGYRCVSHQRQMGVVYHYHHQPSQTRVDSCHCRQRPTRNSIRTDISE